MNSLVGFNTIKLNRDFQSIYKTAKSKHTRHFLCFYQNNNINFVGFTATKKIGNAVKRNRAKRVLRALFIQNHKSLKHGYYVFVAKPSIIDSRYKILNKDFIYALNILGAIKSA